MFKPTYGRISGICALLLSGTAMAYEGELPLKFCPIALGDDIPAECLVRVHNSGFDDATLSPWGVSSSTTTLPSVIRDGNAKLALNHPGDAVNQFVFLPENSTHQVVPLYYLPSLAARFDGDQPAQLKLSASAFAKDGTLTEVFSHTYTVGDTWSRPSGGFDGSQIGEPGYMFITITRTDTNDSGILYVDDVKIVQQK